MSRERGKTVPLNQLSKYLFNPPSLEESGGLAFLQGNRGMIDKIK